MSETNPPRSANSEIDDAEAARQEALERLGVMGAYVAPAMVTLMSSKSSAQSISSGSTG